MIVLGNGLSDLDNHLQTSSTCHKSTNFIPTSNFVQVDEPFILNYLSHDHNDDSLSNDIAILN